MDPSASRVETRKVRESKRELTSYCTPTQRLLQTLQCTRWTCIGKSYGVHARCVLPRYCAGWPYLRLTGSAVKKANAAWWRWSPFLSRENTRKVRIRRCIFPSFVSVSICSFPLRPSSTLPSLYSISFLHDRHTRRLIKSTTKSLSHHRRAENGSLTDSPVELLRDLLLRCFLSPFASFSHVSSTRCLLRSFYDHDVFATIIRYSKRRVFLRLSEQIAHWQILINLINQVLP